MTKPENFLITGLALKYTTHFLQLKLKVVNTKFPF